MPYFNSDGIESTMCGNGGRCAIAFADFLSLIHGEAQFCTIDGSHKGIILEKNGNMTLVNLSMNDVAQLKQFTEGIVIDTGSPHLVIFDKNVDEIDVVSSGRKLRYADTFAPAGTNVDFAEILPDGKSIYVRTYERGVEDETLSCGTGVTAAALAFGSRLEEGQAEIVVTTRGGDLKVSFEKKDKTFTNIWLEGPAVMVYKGNFEF
jgi:diaminopimelate epimerase